MHSLGDDLRELMRLNSTERFLGLAQETAKEIQIRLADFILEVNEHDELEVSGAYLVATVLQVNA